MLSRGPAVPPPDSTRRLATGSSARSPDAPPNGPRLPRSLAPRTVDRLTELIHGAGWRRILVLRRAAATVMIVIALVLAVRPQAAAESAPLLVAAHDLGPGTTLRPADVVVRRRPVADLPAGALREPAQVDGQVLAGAARAGEPLTDLRLVGSELARRGNPDADLARVPVRLADSDVATLLYPGSVVDVVTAGERGDSPVVLAAAAVVLAVLPPGTDAGHRGRLVLVALPRSVATGVAGLSLAQPVTVTLR